MSTYSYEKCFPFLHFWPICLAWRADISSTQWRHNKHYVIWNQQCIDCSGADQREYQSFASLALVRGSRRWPVDSPHKGPVTRKMFPFDDVIILFYSWGLCSEGIRPTCILNTHLMKSRLFILSVFVVQSFWKYQCTHCSVQNFKTMASFSDAGAPRGLSRTSADW